jgi:hypothetical protein
MDTNEIATKVAQWLSSRRHIRAVHPVVVQIGHRTYPAARYAKGNEEQIFVVGELPPLHSKRRVCYQTDDSEETWHLASWLRRKATVKEWTEVYPIGTAHFVLAHHSPLHSWAVDQVGKSPYQRLPMRITEVGPTLSRVKEMQDG